MPIAQKKLKRGANVSISSPARKPVRRYAIPFYAIDIERDDQEFVIEGIRPNLARTKMPIVYYNVIQKRCIMAANALVQTRIDGTIKDEATVVLSAIGLTVSDAVRLMLTRVAREEDRKST